MSSFMLNPMITENTGFICCRNDERTSWTFRLHQTEAGCNLTLHHPFYDFITVYYESEITPLNLRPWNNQYDFPHTSFFIKGHINQSKQRWLQQVNHYFTQIQNSVLRIVFILCNITIYFHLRILSRSKWYGPFLSHTALQCNNVFSSINCVFSHTYKTWEILPKCLIILMSQKWTEILVV
jgi:hypothetical protein